jgi:Concanavalin A-like lectin/glucanases superfamily/PEP-CTERM motif
MRRFQLLGLSFLGGMLATASAARADLIPVASYGFQNTFAADQGGVPALTAVDPLGTSTFVTDTLYGQTRQVYNFNGQTTPADQSGLTVNTTGLISPTTYSVAMVFEFDSNAGWRRIIDVQNRQSDDGFYVNTTNNLEVFPVPGGTAAFTAGVYHSVVLTVANDTINAYLDGVLQFTSASNLMDINNTDNPNNLMGFFLDNVVGGGQGEYSTGKVGLIQLYNGVLDQGQITTLAANPFGAVPEPTSIALMGLGAAGLMLGARRRTRRTKAEPSA